MSSNTAKLKLIIVLSLFVASTQGLRSLPLSIMDGKDTPIQTWDYIDSPSFTSQLAPTNTNQLLKKIKDDFRLGQFYSIKANHTQLITSKPDDPDLLALSAIYLMTKDDLQQGLNYLKKARKLTQDSFYLNLAEAVRLKLDSKYPEAISMAKKALNNDGSHPYPWNILGRIYTEQGDYNEALSSFKKAIKLESRFYPGYLNAGASAILLEDYESANRYFGQAIEQNADDHRAYLGLAISHEASNRPKIALKYFQKSYQLAPENGSILENISNSALKAGEPSVAVQAALQMEEKGLPGADLVLANTNLHAGQAQNALRKLAQLDQNLFQVNYLQAYGHMLTGNQSQALKFFSKSVAINPNHIGAYAAQIALQANANKSLKSLRIDLQPRQNGVEKLLYFIQGNLHADQGNISDALASWKNAEELEAGFSTKGLDNRSLTNGYSMGEAQYINMGINYYFNSYFEQAGLEFEKAIKLNPQSVMANYWRAQVHLKSAQRDQAVKNLRKSLSAAPNFFTALYSIAELSVLARNDNSAIQYYERALKVSENTAIVLKLGILHEKSKEYGSAESYYKRLIKLSPQWYLGYSQLAWLYAKQGIKLEQALNLANKADKILPNNKSITDTIGWIHYHRKDYGLSLELCQKANNLQPDDPTVLYHIGAIYFAKGEKSSGKPYLERALKVSGQFDGIEATKKLLGL